MASLFCRRRTIQRAVSHQLSATAELRLRSHLSGCQSCRRYYDSLTLAARILRGRLSATQSELERQEHRLIGALAHAGGTRGWPLDLARGERAPSRDRPWASALAVPVAAMLLVGAFLSRQLWHETGQTVRLRGFGSGIEKAKAEVLVYAKGKNEPPLAPVRLVADLPGSGEGQLSLRDYVQFSVRHELPFEAYVTVVSVEESGAVHLYETGAVKVPPAPTGKPLVPSVDLSAAHRLGLMRLYAVLSQSPLNPQEVQNAAKEASRGNLRFAKKLPIAGAAEQVSGLFLIADHQ